MSGKGKWIAGDFTAPEFDEAGEMVSFTNDQGKRVTLPTRGELELGTIRQQIVEAPEREPLDPALWEKYLAASEAEEAHRLRSEGVGEKLVARRLRIGWAVVDPAKLNTIERLPVSYHREEPPAGSMKFPAVIVRRSGPWEGARDMDSALGARPEVRTLRRGQFPDPMNTVAAVNRLLLQATRQGGKLKSMAIKLSLSLDGPGIVEPWNHEARQSLTFWKIIHQALAIGKELGQAGILEDPEVKATIAQGIDMERPKAGKGATGISPLIDDALKMNPRATTETIMAELGIQVHLSKPGKVHPTLQEGDLFSENPAIDKLLFRRKRNRTTKKLAKSKTRGDRDWLHGMVGNRKRPAGKK